MILGLQAFLKLNASLNMVSQGKYSWHSPKNIARFSAAPANGELVNGDKEKEELEREVEMEKSKVVQQPGEELVVIQDTGFTIKIQAPGLEVFEIPVSCGDYDDDDFVHDIMLLRVDVVENFFKISFLRFVHSKTKCCHPVSNCPRCDLLDW